MKLELTIILVNYNTQHLLEEVLGRVRIATEGLVSEIIIVDNHSDDNSVDLIKKKYGDIRLIENSVNVGFGRANNQAAEIAKGRHLLLINTDSFIEKDSIHKSLEYLSQNSNCGILGVKLIGRDEVLQPSCRYFPTPLNLFLAKTGLHRVFQGVQMVDDMSWDHATARSCDWVPGCFYLVRREVIDQIGLFDPLYFLYYEEVDHCFRAKQKGWEVHYFPDTTVVHIGGESAKSSGEITESGRQLERLQIESELLYFRKNHGLMGLLNTVTLTLLGDFILSVKSVLKRVNINEARIKLQHSLTYLKIVYQTKYGKQSIH